MPDTIVMSFVELGIKHLSGMHCGVGQSLAYLCNRSPGISESRKLGYNRSCNSKTDLLNLMVDNLHRNSGVLQPLCPRYSGCRLQAVVCSRGIPVQKPLP